MKREVIDQDDEVDRRSSRRPNRHLKNDLSAKKIRAALTNGSVLLTGDIDLRSSRCRRFKDLVTGLESDCGGAGRISIAQASLVRRFAMAEVLLEIFEGLFVERMDADERDCDQKLYGQNRLDQYVRFSLLQLKLAETLGLNLGRQARDVSPLQQRKANTSAVIQAIQATYD